MAGLDEMLQVYGAVNRIAEAAESPSAGIFAGLQGLTPLDFPSSADEADTAAGLAADLDRPLTVILADNDLTTMQKARLLSKVVPRLLNAIPNVHTSPQIDAPPLENLVNALTKLAPKEMPYDQRRARAEATTRAYLRQATTQTGGPSQAQVIAPAVDNGILKPKALDVGECISSEIVVRVNGLDLTCAVVETECSSTTVSLTELKAVINPFNWDKNYPRFFRQMEGCPPHVYDGWTRVLEVVSLAGGGVQNVKTRLRFHTSEDPTGGSARIDYDLDNSANQDPAGDGQVQYDRGWINMWADSPSLNPDRPGVRVRTKKIVHLAKYLPEQQEAAAFFGYSTASAEFVFGCAGFSDERASFEYRGPAAREGAPTPAGSPASPGGGGAPPSPPTPGAGGVAAERTTSTAPAGDGRYFAPTAVSIWRDTAMNLIDDYLDVAGQWTTGQLTADGLATYASNTADRMIRAPFQFLDAMTRPRVRQRDVPKTTDKGDQK